MQVWSVLHVARWKCRTQKIAKNSPSGHHHTTLSGYIFATKARIDNQKNLSNSNTSPTCPHNMTNFGPLTAEICWQVWGTPANFNGFRILALLLQWCRSTEVNQTLAVFLTGTLYIRFPWLLPHNAILPHAKFTLCPTLAFSYIGSISARHSSSGRQRKFVASYKEWNYGTFTEGTTCIRLGGHQVGHLPTF